MVLKFNIQIFSFAPFTVLLGTGRTKELNPEVIEECCMVARSLNLPAEFIFTDLIGKHYLE